MSEQPYKPGDCVSKMSNAELAAAIQSYHGNEPWLPTPYNALVAEIAERLKRVSCSPGL